MRTDHRQNAIAALRANRSPLRLNERETPFLRFWREMNAIVLSISERDVTLGEARELWLEMHPAVRESIVARGSLAR